MKIRHYKPSDFNEIKFWLHNEREHALWCAGVFPYPLEKFSFERILRKLTAKNKDIPFVAIVNGKIAGFFCYSINPDTKEGKLKFVILSPVFRNKGYGRKMISLFLNNAFANNTESVELNVFLCNMEAKNCYLRAGFSIRSIIVNAFVFKDEVWARCNMIIKKPNPDNSGKEIAS